MHEIIPEHTFTTAKACVCGINIDAVIPDVSDKKIIYLF